MRPIDSHCIFPRLTIITPVIKILPWLAAGWIPPFTSVLRSTARMTIDAPFAYQPFHTGARYLSFARTGDGECVCYHGSSLADISRAVGQSRDELIVRLQGCRAWYGELAVRGGGSGFFSSNCLLSPNQRKDRIDLGRHRFFTITLQPTTGRLPCGCIIRPFVEEAQWIYPRNTWGLS